VNVQQLDDLQHLWQEVQDRSQADVQDPGRVACAFVARGARRLAGKRWLQGPRRPPLPCTSAWPEVALFAHSQVYRVEAQVAESLVQWAHNPSRLVALLRVPTPREVLAWQARGTRCVSLLPDGADTGLQPSTLEFALHDLCHAHKFFDPAHHVGQVGWSRVLQQTLESREWQVLTHGFGAQWQAELDHVTADMNGSPLFLYSALRRKVELAAVQAGQDALAARHRLVEALRMDEPVRAAALTFSVHRDVDPALVAHNAALIQGFFESAAACPAPSPDPA
jgi:hypothetical protein